MDIQVEIDGKTYHGSYRVERGRITVSTLEGQKGAELGRMPEMTLARRLLRELVAEGKA